jgi:cytidine deaminase
VGWLCQNILFVWKHVCLNFPCFQRLRFELFSSQVSLNSLNVDDLVQTAWRARDAAYAPYSRFAVGAAVFAADGRVFAGCNVENLSYGLTICSERVAVASAVAAGMRELLAIAVVADTGVPISPCGACRQVMSEFGVRRVILANLNEQLEFSLTELLPRASAGILDRPE